VPLLFSTIHLAIDWPSPRAAHVSRTNFVGTPKPVEDVRQVFRSDAYPVFAEADDYVVVGM
jgi:hypothetical protein